ncbi:MAG TPA: hypothetical protein VLT16_00565 [Candidatus Limnocylindrales bacterium]|nr:hypothetical protein [Candidatus Limnocylindrales bacterium]
MAVQGAIVCALFIAAAWLLDGCVHWPGVDTHENRKYEEGFSQKP